MQKMNAAIGTSLFFALTPGTVAGLVPWAITGWNVGETAHTGYGVVADFVGVTATFAAATVLVAAFVRFVAEGLGTPAPIAPTEHLVVGGLYRYVRNPMYIAVITGILGQALLLGRPVLVAYAAFVAALASVFVISYEQPTLARRYGDEYEAYKQAVPAWLPKPRSPRQDAPTPSAVRTSQEAANASGPMTNSGSI